MNYTKLLLRFILTTILCGLPVLVLAETEPNDSFAQAIPLTVGYSNAVIDATLTTDDEDFYSFTAEAGRTYIIETFNVQGASNRATGIWLYNDQETELANDQYGHDGTGEANTRLVFTFNTAGTYYIKVKDAPNGLWTGTYSLRLLAKYDEAGAAWDSANDYEPNDVPELANEISVGLSGALTHQLFDNSDLVTYNSDLDFYRFTTEANRTYVIEAFDIQGTADRAVGLWLYNEQGAELANDEFGNDGTGEANARIVFTFNTAGTYFIKVKDSQFNEWTGTYSLRILPKYDEPGAAWDNTNDDEPNDVPALANALALGPNQAQTHQIFDDSNFVTPGSDHDYYRFSATAGQTYVFEAFDVQVDASNDATGLWLYNEAGTELANDRHANNGTGNVHARITFEFTTGGTYFLLVKDEDFAQWYGTYSVRACETSCAPVLDQFVFLPLVVR